MTRAAGAMALALRLALALALAPACGSPQAARPEAGPRAGTAPSSASFRADRGKDACRAAYGEYEATWTAAWHEDLAPLSQGTPVDDEVADAVSADANKTLPTRGEIDKIRQIHERVGPLSPTWRAALVAADRAIRACGEGAARPEGMK